MRRKILPYNPKLKVLARELRKNMTLSEVLLWNQLKQKSWELILIGKDRLIIILLISIVRI